MRPDITITLNDYEQRNLGLLLWAIMKWCRERPLMSGDWNGEVLWKLFPGMDMKQIEEYVRVDNCGNASVEEFETLLNPVKASFLKLTNPEVLLPGTSNTGFEDQSK